MDRVLSVLSSVWDAVVAAWSAFPSWLKIGVVAFALGFLVGWRGCQ
jgi:hypothetical protein